MRKQYSVLSSCDIKSTIVDVLALEVLSIKQLIDTVPHNAVAFVKKIITTKGKLIFTGSGKSGLVAQKLAATFSSLGTPSLFLHPHNALHGDLGVVQPQDMVVILSKSASGTEFDSLLSFLKQRLYEHVLLCCDKGPLSSKASFVIFLPFLREACALNLAPTSSSTLMMAFGDAIAVAVSRVRLFTKQDFSQFHPAGALGKRLSQRVEKFMHVDLSLPFLSPETIFSDIVDIISEKKLGLGIVVNQQQALLGIITDGDIRRSFRIMKQGVFEQRAKNIMTSNAKSISKNTLALDALEFMESFNITSLVVVENDRVIGLVHIHDMVKAGLQG